MSTPLFRPKLTTHHLKLIAMISMLIDHIGATIICKLALVAGAPAGTPFLSGAVVGVDMSHESSLWGLYTAVRALGRLALPLYCFLLVEGFHNTQSKPKYIQRLLIFALISEIPYDLAFHGEWFHPDHNNVFLTLSLGFLMMWAISIIREQTKNLESITKNSLKNTISIFMCCLTLAVSTSLHTDYECSGIVAIWILFTLRNDPVLAAFLATLALSLITSNPIQLISLLSIIPIALYNGQKGTTGNRYLFYAFYPAHLLVLATIAFLVQTT